MRRYLSLGLALLAAACGGAGGKADLEHARTVRSLLAEWALVAETDLAGTYPAQMRAEAARQLASAAAAARQSGGPAGAEIAAVASLPADAPAGTIRARAAAARAIESRLAAR